MRYYVTRKGPDGGPITTEFGSIEDAINEVMYLEGRSIEVMNLATVPDCPPPSLGDEN